MEDKPLTVVKVENLIGKTFSFLTVIGEGSGNARTSSRGEKVFKFIVPSWKAKCKCGNLVDVDHYKIKSGHSKSCGCYKIKLCGDKFRTHGLSGTKEHRTWKSMIGRCHRPSHKRYRDWGGRGIKVCDSWKNSFENFLKDMGKCPEKNYSIDRINNDGNYEPGNCRWATPKEQSNNRRKRKDARC